jgi:hypothetical protein
MLTNPGSRRNIASTEKIGEKMRRGVRILILVLAVPGVVHAQQGTSLNSKLTGILDRMQNAEPERREATFDDLSKLCVEEIDATNSGRASGGVEGYENALGKFFARHPDQADRVKLALIRLLETENNAIAMKIAQNGSDTEDYGEYVFELTQAVSALKDERAIPALVGAISRSGVDLLQFGDKALEPVVAQLKNQDALVRATALEIAARILEAKKDEISRTRAEDLIRSSLKDQDQVVRRAATREIVCLDNRQHLVPTLEQIAKTDPAKLPGKALDAGDRDEFYPVRYDARRTLREIQSNKACQHL